MNYTRRDFVLKSLLLLAILLVAFGVRLYNLDTQSLWSDEGNSAAMITRSLAQISQEAARDIHPPLYYWLLKGWTDLAGRSEMGLRSLSVLLGMLLVLATAEFARRLHGENVGLAVAFAAALAPFQVYYSQETRMYILVALLAAASALLMWGLIREENDRLPAAAGQGGGQRLPLLTPLAALLALMWAAGLYTHYVFPLIIALFSAIYSTWLWLSRARGSVGRRALRWVLVIGLALAIFGPWLPIAFKQLTTWPSGGSGQSGLSALQTTLAILGLGPTQRTLAANWGVWALVLVALLGAVPWFMLAPRLSSGFQAASGAPGAGPEAETSTLADHTILLGWVFPIAWVVAPLLMMLVFGLFRDAYLKFLLVASPAYSLLLGRGIVEPAAYLSRAAQRAAGQSGKDPAFLLHDMLAGVWIIVGLALIGTFSGGALVRYYSDPAYARDNYRSIAQYITSTAQPNDAVLLDAPGQQEVFDYYYHGDLPVYGLPRQRPLDTPATLAELDKLLAYDKVYAIYWATQEADPGHLVDGWMNSRGYKTLDQWQGNVRLAVYVMPEHRAPDETAEGLNVKLGADITLLGYRGWNLTPTAGKVTQLQLLWRADATPTRRYKVFLQLLDPHDQVIAQRDAEPAGESRPTDSWKPGEVILDNHGLLISPGTPPGTYRRIIGLYDPQTNERLRLADGSDYVSLPPIRVERASTPPTLAALGMEHPQSFDFGGITLLGHDRYKRGFGHAPDTPIYPGDRLHLTFYWQAKIQPRADWWFALSLNDSAGHAVASMQAPLVGESYSTTLWQKNEIVRGEHDLQIPGDLPPDVYRLSLSLLPDTDTPAGQVYLGTVTVSSPPK